MISAVAEMYNIHPQTLRLYEREGLLMPSRSEGNTRLYTQEDLERLETILSLTRDLGVNLAGIEIILNMRAACTRWSARCRPSWSWCATKCWAAVPMLRSESKTRWSVLPRRTSQEPADSPCSASLRHVLSTPWNFLRSWSKIQVGSEHGEERLSFLRRHGLEACRTRRRPPCGALPVQGRRAL